MNGSEMNTVLDTGAGPSLIDLGTLKHIGLQDKIKKRRVDDDDLVNASGHGMDIIGVVDIPVVIKGGKKITQEFKVLNSMSYPIVLLGRDFMQPFGTVKFDFKKKSVQLGRVRLNCLHVDADMKERVRLITKTVVPARSEMLVRVRCKKNLSMQTVDFDPVPVKGAPGVFVSKARVVPDVCGEFILSVVNVNENAVSLHGRKTLGFVRQIASTVATVDGNSSTLDLIQYGQNMSACQKSEAG